MPHTAPTRFSGPCELVAAAAVCKAVMEGGRESVSGCGHERLWGGESARAPARPSVGPVSYTHLTLPTICSV
eukprot:1987620-Rhodomonas_salina.1